MLSDGNVSCLAYFLWPSCMLRDSVERPRVKRRTQRSSALTVGLRHEPSDSLVKLRKCTGKNMAPKRSYDSVSSRRYAV